MNKLLLTIISAVLFVANAALAQSALAQDSGTGRFDVTVQPADASVCFWLEEWRCEQDVTLQIGSEYFVYASADGYAPLNDRVLLQRDGQPLSLNLQPTDDGASALTQSKPDGSNEQDEAPQIAHSTEAQPVAGQLQSFSASVVDETAVERVTLHYRTGDDFWQRLQMTKTGLDDTYMTTIEAEPGQQQIEYFISAIDVTGNESRIGDANNALVRRILSAEAETADIETAATSQPAAQPSAPAAKQSSGRTWLYVGLGLLVAGALAGGGGGGGDSGGGGGGGDSGTPSFTLNLTPPTQ